MKETSDARSNTHSSTGGSDLISRLIREEARAAVYELVPPNDEPPLYETPEVKSDHPSHQTDNRCQGSPLCDIPAAEQDPLVGPTDTESQHEDRFKSPSHRLLSKIPTWLRIVLGVTPIAAVIICIPVMSSSGVDPLNINVVAFFLLMGTYGVTFIFTFFISIVLKPVATEDDDPPKRKRDPFFSFAVSITWAYHFLALYLFYCLVLWACMMATQLELVKQGHVAARFDAKFATQGALAELTKCLKVEALGRNATISDVTSCLGVIFPR